MDFQAQLHLVSVSLQSPVLSPTCRASFKASPPRKMQSSVLSCDRETVARLDDTGRLKVLIGQVTLW